MYKIIALIPRLNENKLAIILKNYYYDDEIRRGQPQSNHTQYTIDSFTQMQISKYDILFPSYLVSLFFMAHSNPNVTPIHIYVCEKLFQYVMYSI